MGFNSGFKGLISTRYFESFWFILVNLTRSLSH